jgi:hypothetical protein
MIASMFVAFAHAAAAAEPFAESAELGAAATAATSGNRSFG